MILMKAEVSTQTGITGRKHDVTYDEYAKMSRHG